MLARASVGLRGQAKECRPHFTVRFSKTLVNEVFCAEEITGGSEPTDFV
jgi:hypothetical protein